MIKHDYTKLDNAITGQLRKAQSPVVFGTLHDHVRPEAETLSSHPDESEAGWRLVDRRLQALRKKGLIKYQRGSQGGWVLVQEGGAA